MGLVYLPTNFTPKTLPKTRGNRPYTLRVWDWGGPNFWAQIVGSPLMSVAKEPLFNLGLAHTFFVRCKNHKMSLMPL